MGKSKSLTDIKRDIALITLDIECLDPGLKPAAIAHLEETIDLLKVGAGYDLATLTNQNLQEEKKETTLEDAWMFNDDTFVDDIDISNNEIKQEPVNQEPAVISLNPDTIHWPLAKENEMLKCGPCNVYLPRSFTMKRHEEDPHHLERVARVPVKQIDEMSLNISQEESIRHQTFSTGIKTTATEHFCYICQKQYKNRESLRLHNNMHTDKNKCQRCEAQFASRSKLKKHNSNPNNCLALQKIRSSKNESSRSGVDMKLLQCPECPNQYNKKESFRRHRLMHTEKYKCQRCEAPFTDGTKLDIHTRDPKSCSKLQKIRSSTLFKC